VASVHDHEAAGPPAEHADIVIDNSDFEAPVYDLRTL
jgi:hypothetical protein